MYSGVFEQLNQDNYAPTIPKLSLQQWDNYGIYSLACIDLTNRKLSETRKYKWAPTGGYGIIAFEPVLNQESFDLISTARISQDRIDNLPAAQKQQIEDLLKNLDKSIKILSSAERQSIITLRNSLVYSFDGDTFNWGLQRAIAINPGQIISSRIKDLTKTFNSLVSIQFADNTNKYAEIKADENLSALGTLALLYGIDNARINALNNPDKVKMAKWLAWQNFYIQPIPVDFRAIVETYHDVGNIVCSYDRKIGHYLFFNYEDFGGGYVTLEHFDLNGNFTGYKILVGNEWWQLLVGTPSFSSLTWKPFITDREVFDFWAAPLPKYEAVWNTRQIVGVSVIENNGSRYFNSSNPFTLESYPLKPITRISENATRAYRFSALTIINVPQGINGLQPGTHRLRYWVQPQAWETFRNVLDKPCYLDLVTGYCLDNRKIPRSISLKSATKKSVTIGYYRHNPYEEVRSRRNELTSIDWFSMTIDLEKNIALDLDVTGIVLGTFYADSELIVALNEHDVNQSYGIDFLKYNESTTANLFADWLTLYDAEVLRQSTEYPNFMPFTASGLPEVKTGNKLKLLAAHNDYWNNTEPQDDIAVDATHPLFKVDTSRTYDLHFKPQIDGSIGNIKMDSPRTVQIHNWIQKIIKAFDIETYFKMPDSDEMRVWNLGKIIHEIANVLGLRRKPDGTIDESLEKTTNRRLHVEGSEQNDPQKFNPNCFGSEGTIVRHQPNKFSPNGTVAGGYRKIKDIPQLLAEFHEQAGAAMGYQDGTAIEIQVDGETYRYPNQLALLIELFVTLKQTQTYSKGAFFSSIIGEQSIKEVIGGLGLRTVDKFIEFNVAGKTAKLYYKGISASQSIRRKLSALATNIGITNGNIS